MNLNQITISVRDLNKSIEFYELIGLHLIVHTHDGYARFECPVGHTTFSLCVVDKSIKPRAAKFYFEIEKLDETYEELRSKGIVFDGPPRDKTWLWREAWFMDPDGHELCIYWAGENRRFPAWRKKD